MYYRQFYWIEGQLIGTAVSMKVLLDFSNFVREDWNN